MQKVLIQDKLDSLLWLYATLCFSSRWLTTDYIKHIKLFLLTVRPALNQTRS